MERYLPRFDKDKTLWAVYKAQECCRSSAAGRALWAKRKHLLAYLA